MVVLLGPSREAISGVTTHLNGLLGSRLVARFDLVHFQVGSEGRREGFFGRLARLAASPFLLAATLVRTGAELLHINTSLNRKAYWRDLGYLVVAKLCGARVRAAPERALAALEDVYDALGVNGSEERRPRLQVPLRKAA